MGFDYQAALKSGASKQEILQFVQENQIENFDFEGARKAGADDDAIFDFLATPQLPEHVSAEQYEEALDFIGPDPVVSESAPTAPEASTYDTGVLDRMQSMQGAELSGNIRQAPQETVNQDGSISTITTGQPETYDGAASEIAETVAQVPLGVRQSVTLPLAMILEDLAGVDTNTSAENLKKVKERIDNYNKAHPDQIIHPATIGNLASQLAVPMAKTVKGVAALEAGLATLYGIGERGEYGTAGDMAVDATLGAAIGGTLKYSIDKLVKTSPMGALSREAELIVKRNPELNPEEIDALLKGVPRKDQAYVLSRALGSEGKGYIQQALAMGDDTARVAFLNELRNPRKKLLDSIGDIDIDKAKAKYADMVETVAKDYKNVHDGSGMLKDLDFLERFYGVTPSKGNAVVNQMKAVLSENNTINLSEALEFRGDINYLLSKAKRGSEKVKLNRIKENIDGFINRTATSEQKELIDDAVSTYARTMQNRDLADIIAKHSRSGGTIVEDGLAVVSNPNAVATDWVKVKRELADANLNTPEVNMAVNAVEQFAKRFAGDPTLASIAAVRGSSPDGGGVLGAWGYAVNKVKDIFALYGNRSENLKIQKAILKSIRNSKTNKEFIDALLKDKTISDEAKGAVVKAFSPEPVPQIPYNPEARQTGDVNLTPIVPPSGGEGKL